MLLYVLYNYSKFEVGPVRRFVTIFDKANNVHLIKDVGQIPWMMHDLFDYNAAIVTHAQGIHFHYLETETKGLNLIEVPKIRLERYSLSILYFLWREAKSIDVLHLFHHREKSYVYGLIYKWRNPQGVLYLKSDMGLDSIEENHGLFPPKKFKYWLRYWLFAKLSRKMDISSIENKKALDLLCRYYPQIQDKFFYLPNGVNLQRMHTVSAPKHFAEKENLILCVGRIGAVEKNHELLLDTMPKLELKDWQIVFIGPIEERFNEKITLFYMQYPQFKNRVQFVGAIEDRTQLFDWYSRSKILCSTSYKESFGLVMIEAMAYGNAIVTTPVASALEITDNEACGLIIHDAEALRDTLNRLIRDDILCEKMSDRARKRVVEEYDWVRILQGLETQIGRCKA